MNKHRIKLREDLSKLAVKESLPYLLNNPRHRMSAYNSAKRIGIGIVIRESVVQTGFEVTRIK